MTHGDVLTACLALLRAGPRLLVLDNCEHLLDAVHDLVTTVTASCPDVTVLATCREPLRVAAERQVRLAPLPVPDRHTTDLSRLPSVQLFIDRARRVRPEFDPDADDLRRVGDIVRQLDGLPRAIELAAGRLSAFGLVDLHARLDRALDLLRGTATSEERHHTLRAMIEWSAALLSEEERRLFRHLAVFPHGVGLTTIERVGGRLALGTDPASASHVSSTPRWSKPTSGRPPLPIGARGHLPVRRRRPVSHRTGPRGCRRGPPPIRRPRRRRPGRRIRRRPASGARPARPLQAIASQPSLRSFTAYVTGEIAAADGDPTEAEAHYTKRSSSHAGAGQRSSTGSPPSAS
jgi:hypothetical protein